VSQTGGLVTIGSRGQRGTETNDDEDETEDPIHHLESEEQEERDGSACCEDAQARERDLSSKFHEHASPFWPGQDLGGNEGRAKEKHPH
jgi:hypothetical protein